MISPEKVLNELNKIGKKEAIERLHHLYSNTDETKSRIRILQILNRLRDSTHFHEIENYFISDEEPEVRIEAAKLLAFNYRDKKAIEPLIWVCEKEKDREVKFTALRLMVALAQIRKDFCEDVLATLRDLLAGPDLHMKMEAASSLGILEDEGSIEQLIEALKSGKKLVKIRVINALRKISRKEAVPALLKELKQPSYDVWKSACDALSSILGLESLEDMLLERLDDLRANHGNKSALMKGILKALGEIRSKKAVDTLIDFLGDSRYQVRWAAIEALDSIEPRWRKKYSERVRDKVTTIKK